MKTYSTKDKEFKQILTQAELEELSHQMNYIILKTHISVGNEVICVDGSYSVHVTNEGEVQRTHGIHFQTDKGYIKLTVIEVNGTYPYDRNDHDLKTAQPKPNIMVKNELGEIFYMYHELVRRISFDNKEE